MKKQKKQLPVNAINAVLFADIIMNHFYEEAKGMASDYAYYELIGKVEKYLKGKDPKTHGLLPYLDLVLNIDYPAFKKLKLEYEKRYKKISEVIYGLS